MAGHNYHPMCGCDACCREDEAAEREQERREEYIAKFADAAKLLADEDACEEYAADLSEDAARDVMREAGKFFARYHSGKDTTAEAEAGFALYRALRPYMVAAAKEQAATEAADDYGRKVAA